MTATYFVSGSMPNYSDEREYWRWAEGELHYWNDFELDVTITDPHDISDTLEKIKSAIDSSCCCQTARSVIKNATVSDAAYSDRFKRFIIYGDGCVGVYIDL